MATTLPPKEFVCNTETLPVPPTNRIPLQFLWLYDKVQVGHFEMEVLKVRGSNGLFSGLGSMYNPQWGITFKVYFENIAINELYELTDGTVHVETIGAQAYIDSFEDDLDVQDSIPTDDETPEDTDTGIDIPQDTITIDGVIDSVFVDATTGAIVVLTDDGEEIRIDEEDLESEDGSVLLTDSQGNSWVVDKDGNASKNPTVGTETGSGSVSADETYPFRKFVIVGYYSQGYMPEWFHCRNEPLSTSLKEELERKLFNNYGKSTSMTFSELSFDTDCEVKFDPAFTISAKLLYKSAENKNLKFITWDNEFDLNIERC